jgi:hypothetical protein
MPANATVTEQKQDSAQGSTNHSDLLSKLNALDRVQAVIKPGFKNAIEKGVYLPSSGENSGVLILSSDQIAQRLTEALAA